jgi:hypothetical protein
LCFAAALQTTLKHSVRTSHPLFFNQLYARVEPVGVAADRAVAATNTNVHTYEVAPVFSLVEAALLDKVARVIGFSRHDGLFVPGGSISNTYGEQNRVVKLLCSSSGASARPGPAQYAFSIDAVRNCSYLWLLWRKMRVLRQAASPVVDLLL